MRRRSLLLSGLGATTAAATALTGAAPARATDRTQQSRDRDGGLPAAQHRQLTLLVQQYLADRAARVTAARPAGTEPGRGPLPHLRSAPRLPR
ncbi:hypothetical protein ACWC0C_34430 [Streptomyces sp. NPDC001709]